MCVEAGEIGLHRSWRSERKPWVRFVLYLHLFIIPLLPGYLIYAPIMWFFFFVSTPIAPGKTPGVVMQSDGFDWTVLGRCAIVRVDSADDATCKNLNVDK